MKKNKSKSRYWRKKSEQKFNQSYTKTMPPLFYFPLNGDSKETREHFNQQKMPSRFTQIFTEMTNLKNKIIKEEKDNKNLDVIKCLEKILVPNFFGCEKNKKDMFKLIHLILTRSQHECTYSTFLCTNWNLDEVKWLKKVPEDKENYLHRGIRIVLNEIVIPFICKLYFNIKTKFYEIKFIPKVLWRSYLMKVYRLLLKKQHIVPVCEEKKKTNVRGNLIIIPKSNLSSIEDYRPIVKLRVKGIRGKVKPINVGICEYSKTIGVAETTHFHLCWSYYLKTIGNAKIYAAKLDLKDCYGNVNISTLISLLEEIPIKYISRQDKKELIERVQNQFVYFKMKKQGKTKVPIIWQWKHGLLQGDTFSGVLCELYIAHMEKLYLQKFKQKNNLIHRKVDDYFFCSTNKETVIEFIELLTKYSTINTNKTISNVDNASNNRIPYIGKEIDLEHRHIRPLFHFSKECRIHQRFKLWNQKLPLRRQELLQNVIIYSRNNHHFSVEFFNEEYNNENVSLENFYLSMCFIAHKLDAALMVLMNGKFPVRKLNEILQIISHAIFFYARKCTARLRDYFFNKFLRVGHWAFIAVFKRRNFELYLKIVKELKEVNKINYVKNLHPSHFQKLYIKFSNICLNRKYKPFLYK